MRGLRCRNRRNHGQTKSPLYSTGRRRLGAATGATQTQTTEWVYSKWVNFQWAWLWVSFYLKPSKAMLSGNTTNACLSSSSSHRSQHDLIRRRKSQKYVKSQTTESEGTFFIQEENIQMKDLGLNKKHLD